MTITEDARKLLAHCDEVGLDLANTHKRGWNHLGAVIVDSALQRRQRYKATVLPRIHRVLKEWPEATTTSAFAARIAVNDLGEFLPWGGHSRILQIHETVRVLLSHGVETTADFATRLEDPTTPGADLRRDLLAIRGIGSATMDYFRILVGLDGCKFDTHLMDFARDAGIGDLSHGSLAEVFKTATAERPGVTLGSLDAAIWEYESTK